MKKMIICVLMLCLSVTVYAHAAAPVIADNSSLLTYEEAQKLEELVETVSDRWEIDIVILTTDSLEGKSAMAYADDYYDDHGYADDGVLLLVSMTEREWWISTCGKCIWAIDADQLGSRFVPYLSSGNYYDAFTAFLEGCDIAMEADNDRTDTDIWIPDMQIQGGYPSATAKPQPAISLGMCIVIGAVIGLVAVLVMKGQLKSVRAQSGADSYVRTGSLQLSHRSDMFLYQNTTRRAKPQNNNHSGSHGGGGGIHVGSSGRSHGGGGGRF